MLALAASDIAATAHGDILVVRYHLETEKTIEGIAVSGTSPRLSLFRNENGTWLSWRTPTSPR